MKKRRSRLTPLVLIGLPVALIALYFSGWAPRDLDRPEHRLLGHWRVIDQGKGVALKNAIKEAEQITEYYLGPIDPQTGRGRFLLRERAGRFTYGTYELDEVLSPTRVRLIAHHARRDEVWTITAPGDGARLTVGGPLGMMKAFDTELQYVDAHTSSGINDLAQITERVRLFQIGLLP